MSEEQNEPETVENGETLAKKSSASRARFKSLHRNYLSFAGIAIAGASLLCIGFLFLMELTSGHEQPYLGIFTYILFPAIMIFGFALVAAGMILERRRRRRTSPDDITPYPVLDLNNGQQRRTFLILLFAVFVFVFASVFGSYRVYEYSESVAFCGQLCHVMNPEFVAYNDSPHAQVACVECHVGGGAEWYLRAKFNGVRQLYGVVTDSYNKPIETPVHNMRPANDTCAKCHWSEKFHGDKLKVFEHFGFDENNSRNTTRMLIKVGGGTRANGDAGGIHWHMNLANEITFAATDPQRQNIPWVRFKDADGNVIEYKAKDSQLSPDQIGALPKRTMDCIDCHNRPAHIYNPPDTAVDKAFSANKLDITLPFLKLKAVEFLSKDYASTDEALSSISAGLDAFYRETYPAIYLEKRGAIQNSINEVRRIYQNNFFPEMKTDWRTHPNNIGHFKAQGCFRCHDGQHFSSDGKVIRNDCAICHTTIDQSFAGTTFIPRENRFQHPVNLGDRNTSQCAACHKADRAFKHPLNLGDISRFQCSECHKSDDYKISR